MEEKLGIYGLPGEMQAPGREFSIDGLSGPTGVGYATVDYVVYDSEETLIRRAFWGGYAEIPKP
jgi:hypothetical protein